MGGQDDGYATARTRLRLWNGSDATSSHATASGDAANGGATGRRCPAPIVRRATLRVGAAARPQPIRGTEDYGHAPGASSKRTPDDPREQGGIVNARHGGNGTPE